MRPATTSTQRCDEFHVRIEPEARLSRHIDYFGTEVLEFGIADRARPLTIDVRARVVTVRAADPADGRLGGAGDAGLPRGGRRVPAAGQTSRRSRGARRPVCRRCATTRPLAAVPLLCELIPDRSSTARARPTSARRSPDLLEAGAGVCQDFVHLALMLLRRRGIAARYVSGYLWAAPADGGADSVEVDTHAWLEALLPGDRRARRAGLGRRRPDQPRPRGETHVKIGHGRPTPTSRRSRASTAASRTSTLEAP